MTRWLPDLEGYYHLHTRFYDATRWAFLFGRNDLLRRVQKRIVPRRVLEVGCGTGTNLRKLARVYPDANLTGVDLSPEMLAKTERKRKTSTAYAKPFSVFGRSLFFLAEVPLAT